eukprot:NODE_7447_length_567_cov_7.945946_g6433_i0.p2 GENE.NODE_7447_length_567_cov_7.945946_g6433_i0~~NODE_7447_length_567_cov_7.945946_g6433_i0.p2  ORF type:complete len:67 (-),score=8.54 NODE_7447_length_567_cov_7.945946_g6433_i0:153-353(-)
MSLCRLREALMLKSLYAPSEVFHCSQRLPFPLLPRPALVSPWCLPPIVELDILLLMRCRNTLAAGP